MCEELEILRDYIRSETGYDGELEADLDLLDEQILDSFSIVQMAVFIQDRFALELDANDLVRDNLASLSKMVELIARRRSTTADE